MEMAEDFAELDEAPPPVPIGAQLRAAREARGLTLEEVAAASRIPQRHLVTIEAGDFQALPARTYAIGFSRTYARFVGLDEEDVAESVRAELDAQEPRTRYRAASFEPGDPARVPSRALGWLSALAVVLVLAGLYFATRTYFAPAAELPSLVEQQRAEQAALAAKQGPAGGAPRGAAVASGGPVVFTALEEAWVRFYTPEGTLTERLMTRGDTYEVPADADRPMLRTGRPDALRITIGGRPVPKLAEEQQVMSDVVVTAKELLARPRRPNPASLRPASRSPLAASPTT
jgi:transcriptional regulator with XRE-family HTH domain